MKNQTPHERLKDLMVVRPWAASVCRRNPLGASFSKGAKMEASSEKRRTETEIRKEDFGLVLEKTIGKVGFISSALLE